jgi:hypothetical protein
LCLTQPGRLQAAAAWLYMKSHEDSRVLGSLPAPATGTHSQQQRTLNGNALSTATHSQRRHTLNGDALSTARAVPSPSARAAGGKSQAWRSAWETLGGRPEVVGLHVRMIPLEHPLEQNASAPVYLFAPPTRTPRAHPGSCTHGTVQLPQLVAQHSAPLLTWLPPCR